MLDFNIVEPKMIKNIDLLFLSFLIVALFSSCNKDEISINNTDSCDNCDNQSMKYCAASVSNFECISLTKAPEFIDGGESGFGQAITGEVNYPAEARRNNIEGDVIISFIVNENGAVNNITIKEDIGFGCGDSAKSAIQIVTDGTSFYPGELNGQQLKVKREVTLHFKLG